MAIIYVCDRCGDHTNDESKVQTVSLCQELHGAVTVGTLRRVGPPDSVRMLCGRCVSQVQATITEQLPMEAKC